MTGITGECHPACLLLPEMTADEFRELVEDIRQHKQRRPILVDEDGLILDGRHRWRACKEIGLEPYINTVCNITEAGKVALIVSENIHRRHLTTQQRAAVAAELAEKLAEAARGRQLAGTSAPTDAKGKAAGQAAKMIGGVSTRTVERAIVRKREDPAAHEKAKKGELPRKAPAAPSPERQAAAREAMQVRANSILATAKAPRDELEWRYGQLADAEQERFLIFALRTVIRRLADPLDGARMRLALDVLTARAGGRPADTYEGVADTTAAMNVDAMELFKEAMNTKIPAAKRVEITKLGEQKRKAADQDLQDRMKRARSG